MTEVSVLRAFLAGAVSFLSPCVLYLMPLYGALAAAWTILPAKPPVRRAHPLGLSLGFFGGFSLIFIMTATVSFSAAGDCFFDALGYIRIGGAVLLLLNSLLFVGLLRGWSFSNYRAVSYILYFSASVIGMSVSAAWTPCSNPALGTILLACSTPGSMLHGTGLLVIYAAGLAAPFLLAGAGLAKILDKVRLHPFAAGALLTIDVVVLLLFTTLLITDNLRQLTALMPDYRLSY